MAALLQWWHQQQLQVCRTEAEGIRNGLMQEVFAMRRQSEVVDEAITGKHRCCCEWSHPPR